MEMEPGGLRRTRDAVASWLSLPAARRWSGVRTGWYGRTGRWEKDGREDERMLASPRRRERREAGFPDCRE